jgi:DNA polymerase
MNVISIDIETFSDIDLGKCGVYRYAESPSFDILLFSYSMDDGQIKLIDLAGGEKLPEEIINSLMDASIIKTAFNANFERVCLMKYLCRVLGKEVYLDPSCQVLSQSYEVSDGTTDSQSDEKTLRLRRI